MLVFGGVCDPQKFKVWPLGPLAEWEHEKTKPVLFFVELLTKLEVYGVSFSKYTFPLKLPSSLGFIWLFVHYMSFPETSHVAILAFGRNFNSNNNHLCIHNFQRKQSTTPERTPPKEIPSSQPSIFMGIRLMPEILHHLGCMKPCK